jgi:DNA-binding NtrC family response regulator
LAPRLIVDVPNQSEPEWVELIDSEVVLLGRVPNTSRVTSDASVPAGSVRSVAIASPGISANHAAVWSAGGELIVRDLESRNGTWVRLPHGTTARLPVAAEIRLRLGMDVRGTGEEALPDRPHYTDAADFGAGIANAVDAWLNRQHVQTRVWVGAEDTRGEPVAATPMRLLTGQSLFVQAVHTVDERFQERMARVCRYVAEQNALFAAETATRSDGMVLASSAMRLAHQRVVETATKHLPSLLVMGPSGTGKEWLARAYHRHLGRGGPWVAVNCAMLTRERLVADLFGAEKGAYTGAQHTMRGAVECASGGTLFLDEVGEIPLDVQPQLLRFLETGEYQRLGAIGQTRVADVRVVTATNRDLREMARAGTFREDLFFRLALQVVEVPPLHRRFADAVAYLKTQNLGPTSAYDALQPAALEILRTHAWPGNFRELINFVRRLPCPAGVSSLDAECARRAIEMGTHTPIRCSSAPQAVPAPQSIAGWMDSLQASARAFAEDSERATPETWSDVTVFIEQYLKPWALARLAGVADAPRPDEISIARVAERVRADRGTVVKQLGRYFEAQRERASRE